VIVAIAIAAIGQHLVGILRCAVYERFSQIQFTASAVLSVPVFRDIRKDA
jgi:hypothetical protein